MRAICQFFSVVFTVLFVAACVNAQCPAYSYSTNAANGPSQWGSLCNSFSLCSAGTKQSPVNILSLTVSNLNTYLDVNYYAETSVSLMNNGLFLNGDLSGYGNVGVSDETNYGYFELSDFQIKTPSEHAVNGYQYPAEVQYYHQQGDQTVAIAYFIQVGTNSRERS